MTADTNLGSFEGRKIQAAALAITGAQLHSQVGKVKKGDVVYFIGKGVVDEVAFKDKKINGTSLYTRVQGVGAERIVLLEAKDGQRMLEESIMLRDELFGVESLFHTGDDNEPAPPHEPGADERGPDQGEPS